uniref:Uncharacterized protein n=1 Tax=Strigamia maritima TaxID=126957 RepID=T1IWD2_STRMM
MFRSKAKGQRDKPSFSNFFCTSVLSATHLLFIYFLFLFKRYMAKSVKFIKRQNFLKNIKEFKTNNEVVKTSRWQYEKILFVVQSSVSSSWRAHYRINQKHKFPRTFNLAVYLNAVEKTKDLVPLPSLFGAILLSSLLYFQTLAAFKTYSFKLYHRHNQWFLISICSAGPADAFTFMHMAARGVGVARDQLMCQAMMPSVQISDMVEGFGIGIVMSISNDDFETFSYKLSIEQILVRNKLTFRIVCVTINIDEHRMLSQLTFKGVFGIILPIIILNTIACFKDETLAARALWHQLPGQCLLTSKFFFNLKTTFKT